MIGDKLPENPEKNGFVFTGWNTAKDGSGQEVTPDSGGRRYDSICSVR